MGEWGYAISNSQNMALGHPNQWFFLSFTNQKSKRKQTSWYKIYSKSFFNQEEMLVLNEAKLLGLVKNNLKVPKRLRQEDG